MTRLVRRRKDEQDGRGRKERHEEDRHRHQQPEAAAASTPATSPLPLPTLVDFYMISVHASSASGRNARRLFFHNPYKSTEERSGYVSGVSYEA
jgi:hypothetical protein